MKAHIFFTIGLFFISSTISAQLFLGADMTQANFKQVNTRVYEYSAYDLGLGLKYQVKKINISVEWNRISRINNSIDTESDRISLTVNYLLNKEDKKLVPSVGFGYFFRKPYQLSSSNIDMYYNSGLVSNVSLNFPSKFGYTTIGLKNNIDLFNSLKNNDLKLMDFGFFISANLNIFSIFSKN